MVVVVCEEGIEHIFGLVIWFIGLLTQCAKFSRLVVMPTWPTIPNGLDAHTNIEIRREIYTYAVILYMAFVLMCVRVVVNLYARI